MNDHLIVHDCGIPIGSLASKLKSHQDNDNIHLTPEEKEKLRLLNIKDYSSINAQDINDIKTELKNKADADDIPERVSQLENDLNFISEIPDYYTTEEEVKLLLKGYIGDYINQEINIEDIDKKIEELTELINKYKIDLDELKKIIESLDIPEDLSNLISKIQQQIEDIYSKISDLDSRVSALEDWKDDNPDGPDDPSGPGYEYELPVATSTILGGIKVGSGLEITSDGVLSTVGSDLPIDPDGPISVDDILNETDRRYLSKIKDDSTQHHLTIQDGITIGDDDQVSIQSSNFAQGETLGKGFFLGQWGDSSYLEVDRMSVRKQAFFNELEIRKLSYVNGTVVLSPTGSVIESVKEVANGWKCILKPDDGSMSTTNSWVVNDMARCEEFGEVAGDGETKHNVRTKYYWRAVTEVGYEGEEDTSEKRNYVVLSNENGAYDGGSGVPQPGDTIVCFGHMADTLGDDEGFDRRNLIELSSTSMDSPSLKMYSNIHAFNDNYTEQAVISPSKILFNSKLFRLITNDGETPICIDRGAWTATSHYDYWDRVSHGGRLWLCVNENGSYGITPPEGMEPGSDPQGGYSSEDYWLLQIDKGQDGDTSGVYQMQLTDLVLFTQKTTDGYSPNIVGREIGVTVYQGTEQLSGSQYTILVTPERGITVGSQHDNGFTITGCTLNGGETADIVIKVTIGDTGVSLQQSIQVICTQNPVEEDSYNVIVDTAGFQQTYGYSTNDDGRLTEFTLRTLTARVSVYNGEQLLSNDEITSIGVNSNQVTGSEVVIQAILEPVGKSVVSPDESTSSDTSIIYEITRDLIGDTTELIPEDIRPAGVNIYYPITQAILTLKVWYPNNRTYASPSYQRQFDIDLDIEGIIHVWEVTNDRFTSTIKDLETDWLTRIEQTNSKIEAVVETQEGINSGFQTSVNDLNGKVQELENNFGVWKEDAITGEELEVAGLFVDYDMIDNTGNVRLVADKFTLMDQEYSTSQGESGNRYIWYQDGVSAFNITKGYVGGFSIEDNKLQSSMEASEVSGTSRVILSPETLELETFVPSDAINESVSYIRLATQDTAVEISDSSTIYTPAFFYGRSSAPGAVRASLVVQDGGGILTGPGARSYSLYSNGQLYTDSILLGGGLSRYTLQRSFGDQSGYDGKSITHSYVMLSDNQNYYVPTLVGNTDTGSFLNIYVVSGSPKLCCKAGTKLRYGNVDNIQIQLSSGRLYHCIYVGEYWFVTSQGWE